MADQVGLLAFLGLLALVVLFPDGIGRLRALGARKPKKGEEPEPVCGCEHHLAFHTNDGVCKGKVQVQTGFNEYGQPTLDYHDCACQQYRGPVPSINPRVMLELTNPGPGLLDESGYWLDGQHRLKEAQPPAPEQ